ncbi:YcxB family protein [Actinoplanes sp. NPDC026670]|uniref:YcxB family protein n=1 Tax=Actinoplanes sp. NPDC026670 TaxID=3154700 RepID=UPI0033FD0345
MNIAGDHHFTYRTFRRIGIEAFPKRRLLQGIGAAGLVLVLVTGVDRDNLIPLFGSAFCLVFPELVALALWYPQRKQAAQTTHYTLDDDGIRVRTATSDVHLTWAGVTGVKSQPQAWLLRHGATQLAVPRAAFRPEDRVTIDAFLAAHPAVATK